MLRIGVQYIATTNCVSLLKFICFIAVFIVCLLASTRAWPQVSSNIRVKKIAVQPAAMQLDSMSAVPGSFRIAGMDSLQYAWDDVRATLQWIKLPNADSVWVSYRVFPFGFANKVYRYQYDSVANFFKAMPVPKRKNNGNNQQGFGKLNYTGSFGRSLSFGNAQDAVVNSLFNLQVNGMLGDSIEIAAAITDNNIPIQPDGNTQQLNEFDRIWLQFKKRNWTLSLGDIDVRQQPTYFLSYFKRQQGIAFETTQRLGKQTSNTSFVSAAIAKGKFTRNVFNGQEGNQGPYRLRGANNELFFVILAGTERVFIDGVQLQRGEDQDYVINYNTAEISFTPKQLISRDKRIQVEFEYADRNYLNSLLYAGNALKVGEKLEVNIGMYSNADAKNSPINQTLDNVQRQFLSNIGDSINQAFYPVAVRDSFDAAKVLYIKIDTTLAGQPYTFYRYKSTYDTAMYSLAFSEVGNGKGNYTLLLNGANGKVFQWVAPVNGVAQGNYEPVALLVTPKKQQLFTVGVKYQFTKSTKLLAEAGYSVTDINTFASKDKRNDGGLGIKLQLKDERAVKLGKTAAMLNTEARFEQVAENFRPLERLRSIEFLRDWGLPFDAGFAKEQLPGFTMALSNNKQHSIQYDYSGYKRGEVYNGNRHSIEHRLQQQGWVVNDVLRYTSFDGLGINGYFLRPSVSVNKTLSKLNALEIGAQYQLEHNQVKSSVTDTLQASSFSFTDWRVHIRSNQQQRNRWSLQWFRRSNQFALADGFVPQDVNDNFSIQVELTKSKQHQFRLNTGYRMLKVKTAGISNQQSDNTLLGRAEYLTQLAKGAITGNLLYEIGAGQEQQRDFSYIEVPAGRGEYAWIDYNGDAVPQLNEFELAQFQDQAKYIRIFTPTNRFVKAAYNTLNTSIQLSPANIWRRDSSQLKRFLAKWNAQSSLQSTSKRKDDGGFPFNPFSGSISDTAIIMANTNIANTLSFNRYSTSWGVDLTQVRNSSKALLTYGVEIRTLNDVSLRWRKNAGRQWTFAMQGKRGSNELQTPNPKFDNRNYTVTYHELMPSLTYTLGATFRATTLYKWNEKKGLANNIPQLSTTNSLQVESKYNLVQSGVFTGKLTYTSIDFTGTSNSTVSYFMLDGLQPGKNFLWNFDFTKRLANALEISFQYEGRKAGDSRTIHVGRASLRAVL